MRPTAVKVPARLLLDPDLTGAAKLLWSILKLGAPVPRRLLQTRSGLSLPTIRRGLAQLQSAGWLSPDDQPIDKPLVQAPAQPFGTASLPSDLLLAPRVSVQAKLLYGILQLTPNFVGESGVVTIAELGALTGHTLATLRAATLQLRTQEWLQAEQSNKFKPIHFRLRNPVAEMREQDVEFAKRHIEESTYKAEALMREFLSLIVASDDFDDNVTPGYLINPYTGEEMQFDRYYRVGVAFEYNGPQHYHTTALYSKESKVRKQQGRDLMKHAICMQRSITLVVIHLEDLSLEGIRQKVPSLLPLRDLDSHQPLVTYLERVGRNFRRKGE